MPAKGWKKNADGISVGPSDPTHPDNVGGAATVTALFTTETEVRYDAPADEHEPAVPSSISVEAAPPLEDGSTIGEHETDLPDLADESIFDSGPNALQAFWIGLLPSAPVSNVLLAGVCFPLRTQVVGPGSAHGGKTSRHDMKGQVVHFTPEQVERVKHAARALVVRKQGQGDGARRILLNADPRHFAHDPRNPGRRVREYVPQRGDTPIGCYAYMVAYDHTLGPNWQAVDPAPMIPLPAYLNEG